MSSTRRIPTRSSTRRAAFLALASTSEKAFVAAGHHLVEFLDTVSLAHFTATCKEHRPLLDLEVHRRKAKIQEYEERVKELIGCQGEEPPEFYVRADVEAAEKLCQAAMRLIGCGPFFRDERAKFVPPPRTGILGDGEHPRSQQHCLLMLPAILYLPKTGEPVHPDREAIDKMGRLLQWTRDNHAPEKHWWRLVIGLVSDPQIIETFRFIARLGVWRSPSNLAAMPKLTLLLHTAEEFAASHPSSQQRIVDYDSEY
jgi:hypothetical protein